MTSPPLLVVADAQVVSLDASAHVLAPSLSVALAGPRAVVVGHAEPVLGPLFRRARVTSGRFELLGVPLDQVDPSTVGLVPLDPLLPSGLDGLACVTWSGRLAGLGEKEALSRARERCEQVGLGAWAAQKIETMHAVHRRLVVLAQALLLDPAVLIVEAPLAGLDPAAASHVLAGVTRACEGRAALLSSPPFEPGSPSAALVDGCDQRADLP